jgi:acyl carrier protein
MLVQIWEEVLEVEDVRINDNFFDMGGHSLLAILITARVREAFKIDLPLRSIFDAPTVAALARVIVEKQRGGATSQPAAIKSVPRVGPMPLSFEQDHLWKIEQADPGRAFYIISTALMLAAIDVELLKVALREVFKRHESLRTRFDVIDGNPAQIISESTEFDLHLVDLSHLPEEQDEETLRLALENATRPFDTRGRL